MNTMLGRIVSLNDLLALEADRIMQGEKMLLQALPGWMQRVSFIQLRNILSQYHSYIEHHTELMTGFFIIQPATPYAKTKHNRVINALIEDTNERLHLCADPEIYDACLLAAIQEINHYKISIYGTVTAFCNELGQRDMAAIFLRAEKDEKRIDEQLSFQAQSEINELAKTPVIK